MIGQSVGRISGVCGLIILSISFLCAAGVTLRVFDNGGTSDDDLARVWIDGQSLGEIAYNPGGTNQRTWDLGIPSVGTHILIIEFTEDADATDLCEEHVGTFGIEFGGGGLAASDDGGSVARGSSVDIDVLSNDVYVQAGSTATDSIPCPSESPAPSGGCSCGDPRTTYQTTFNVSGGALTIDRIVSAPSKGTAQIVGDVIRYTPNPDGCGIDTFTYEAEGPSGSSDTATVTVTISSLPPTAFGDSAETPEETSISIDVLDNDVDSGGGTLSIDSVGIPSHGTATIDGDRIRYTPQPRFEGTDRFTYAVRDLCGSIGSAMVEVRVVHANHPPTAHAGAFYRGFAGEPLELDASFSLDPDIEDSLQYRWDLDDDGRFETDWLNTPRTSVTYDRPFIGTLLVEVRDLYLGQPTGTSDRATASVRIEQRPPELHGILFIDLDADGVLGPGEPPLSKIQLSLDGEIVATTDEEGRVTFANLDPGEHTIAITTEGKALLALQGFGVDASARTLDVQPGDPAIAPFPVRPVVGSLVGFVFVDTDGSGEQEQGEPAVPGLTVSLGEGLERVTNDDGQFLFMNVPAGEYLLSIEGERHRWEGTIRIVPGEATELIVIWPAPDSGFLDVKIQLSDPGGE